MAASSSESIFHAPMDIESLNGTNGSMDPTSVDHAAHKLPPALCRCASVASIPWRRTLSSIFRSSPFSVLGDPTSAFSPIEAAQRIMERADCLTTTCPLAYTVMD